MNKDRRTSLEPEEVSKRSIIVSVDISRLVHSFLTGGGGS